ncbi:hypothetical protein [Humibacter ginsenosidimutans]|uniref:4-hydroxybenzoate polyprenyltransferase n=1 Tax=Humibacter ginsenosidimutans TaxID=2599293 RepID=A0A5B8M1S2_9MICO|nr:hypothetical protein [Humibacter ginsenosidimutans]QDZ13991.1 hypothetical protein FPZ11_03635 [Humibacter ginsenosidimutans]
MSIVAAAIAEGTSNAYGVQPWVLGIVVLCVFAVLAFVTWTYRDVANRHSHKAEADAAQHAGAPGAYHHGAGHPGPEEH